MVLCRAKRQSGVVSDLRLGFYSQAGTVLFPRWEHFIPNVGIIVDSVGTILNELRLIPISNQRQIIF